MIIKKLIYIFKNFCFSKVANLYRPNGGKAWKKVVELRFVYALHHNFNYVQCTMSYNFRDIEKN